MSSKLKIKVTKPDGSSEVVVVRPVTQVALERAYKMGIGDANHAEHMYWMAWHASGSPGKFDDWLDQIDDVDPVDDEDDDAGPLAGTRPPGESLPQPSNPAPA